MFISRKKLKYLEKRIADLEVQVQGQQKVIIESMKLAGSTMKIKN